MKYYSLADPAHRVSFREATLRGQAPGQSLYYPEKIPQISTDMLAEWKELPPEELGYHLLKPYVGGEMEEPDLRRIVSETVAFPFPLRPLKEGLHVLELFHGPTLAFKDVGARFMSRCLRHFVAAGGPRLTVLVATSGDTGGAVASGFHGVDGIDVVILYPAGKVSRVQELQLTTYGGNVQALRVEGSFDDCQALVKTAFEDESLRGIRALTSANSINVARWIPQQLYYFFAWQKWQEKDPPVFVVPSGNFGNICAGLLAHRSGLPAARFVAACNANNVVTRYLHTGRYEVKAPVATLSNAMDVGSPSNFVRIAEMLGHDHVQLRQVLHSAWISDEETRQAITGVYHRHGYTLDPHGAVGYAAWERYRSEHPDALGILLETAHPMKFQPAVESILGRALPVPDAVAALFGAVPVVHDIEASYAGLKKYLLHHG